VPKERLGTEVDPENETIGSADVSVQQLLLPGIDLVRVNPVPARQLGDRPVALDRRQRQGHRGRPCSRVTAARAAWFLYDQDPKLAAAVVDLNGSGGEVAGGRY
jgi:hypothetical protein